jgi:hypothetical protein
MKYKAIYENENSSRIGNVAFDAREGAIESKIDNATFDTREEAIEYLINKSGDYSMDTKEDRRTALEERGFCICGCGPNRMMIEEIDE